MAEQKSRLVVEIDSRNSEQKAIDLQKSLDALESAGLRIKPAMDKASTGLDGLNKSGSDAGKSADGAGKAWSAATDGIGRGIQQVVKELQSLNAKQDAAAKLIESLGLSLSKASTSFLDVASSAGKLKPSNDAAAASIEKVGETAAQAEARLLAMAKRSLEASEYVNALSTGTGKAASSFDYAADKAERLSELARRMRAESDANVKTNNTLADGTRKAAAATEEQAQELEKLLGKIDPVYRKLAEIDQLEKELAKNKKFLDAGTFADYQAKIAATRKTIGGIDEDLKGFGLTTKGAQRDAAQLLNALRSGDWQGAARNFQQISVSAGGAGNAIKSLGSFAASVVNPVTATAAITASLGFIFYDAEKQVSAFNQALFSGTASSGQTTANLAAIAKSAAGLSGSFSSANDAVIALAGSSKLSQAQFIDLAQAASAISAYSGKGAAEVAIDLASIGDSATKAAEKMSAKYGLLTSAQYELIAALEQQGRKQEALDVLSSSLNENAQHRLEQYRESLSSVERGWNDIGTAISNAYSMVKSELFPDLQKEAELIERVLKTRKKGGVLGALSTGIGKASSAFDSALGLPDGDSTEALEKKLVIIKQRLAFTQQTATVAGVAGLAEQSRIEALGKWDALHKKNLFDQAKLEYDIKEVRELGLEAGKSQIEIDKEVANIQAKYNNNKAKPKAYQEDVGQKMLDQARQQFAVLQEQGKLIADQTTGTVTLGAEAKKLITLETTLAELKKKGTLTTAQKQILAMGELNVAQQKLNAGLEKQNQLSAVQLENAARLKAYQDGLNAELNLAQEGLNNKNAGTGLGDRAKARIQEDLKIQQDYQKRINKLTSDYNNSTDKSAGRTQLYDDEVASAKAALDKRLAMQKDSYANEEELRANWLAGTSTAWQNYVDIATNYNQQAQEGISQTLNNTTSSISDQIQGLLKGTTDLGDAFINLGETMGSSILQALSDIAAKWIVVQALKMAGIDLETEKTVASEGIKTSAKLTTDAVSTSSTLAAIATTLAANVAAAATTVASWLPAALVASIGSFGAAAVVGGGALVAAYALLKGFSSGGYTGPGGVNEPAGVVHKGEVVWSQADISRHGGVATVESLRKGNVSPIRPGAAGSGSGSGSGGQDSGAGKPGGNVNIHNYGGNQVEAQRDGNDWKVFINRAKREIAGDLANGNGDITRALTSGYGLRRVPR